MLAATSDLAVVRLHGHSDHWHSDHWHSDHWHSDHWHSDHWDAKTVQEQ